MKIMTHIWNRTGVGPFWLVLLLIFPVITSADWQFRTSNRMVGNGYFNPGNDALIERQEDLTVALENRLLLQGSLSKILETEIHIVTTLDYSTRRLADTISWPLPEGALSRTAFRHPDLTWEWKETDSGGRAVVGASVIDRLMLCWNTERTALTVGRQAIGLSTCFYLTTNDFFQPFAPEAIYREYKSGVDAVNFQYFTDALSEIDVITVAGYDSDNEIDWDESAALVRSVFSAGSYEWTVMAGKLPWRWFVAGALQGEIAGFGVRAECNVNFPEDGWRDAFGSTEDDTYYQIAAGIDYRYENSLHLFTEYLYREHGYRKYKDYLLRTSMLDMIREAYSATQYLSVAASYQWHPLVTSQILGIGNLDDTSVLFSGTMNISLADEADLILGGTVTVGDEPEYTGSKTPKIPTQYGATPDSVYVELRVYL